MRERTVEGETYTMKLNVTSTCENSVEIGFTRDNGCWFCSNVTPNAVDSIITVTDKWELMLRLRLESRTKCAGKSLTIHQIQLAEGPEDCFSGGIFHYGMKISFLTKNTLEL